MFDGGVVCKNLVWKWCRLIEKIRIWVKLLGSMEINIVGVMRNLLYWDRVERDVVYFYMGRWYIVVE